MSSKDNKYKEKVVLSYHHCLLRNDDVDLLKGPHWLNDALMGFYFEYLEHERNVSTDEKPKVLFVSPELTQLLKLTETSDYPALLGPLEAIDCDYIFFPLNNCESRVSAGGSHWSLLVFSKNEKTLYHLDSCIGFNKHSASVLANKVLNYLLGPEERNIILQVDNCPQQKNGYDCGLFALCLADIILKHIDKCPEIGECKLDGAKSLVRTKREELLDLIEKLKNMQEK